LNFFESCKKEKRFGIYSIFVKFSIFLKKTNFPGGPFRVFTWLVIWWGTWYDSGGGAHVAQHNSSRCITVAMSFLILSFSPFKSRFLVSLTHIYLNWHSKNWPSLRVGVR
jgi:hypothetical protein